MQKFLPERDLYGGTGYVGCLLFLCGCGCDRRTGACAHVHMDNTQGDLRFLEVLEHMGCTADDTPEGILVTGPADGALRGITVNMNDFSDQALTLAAIAPVCRRAGAHRGNRTYPWAGMRPDSRDTDEPDSAWHPGVRRKRRAATIYPGSPHGGSVETYDDHRVAMAFSLVGLRTDGIVIENPACCRKTFENYFTVLSELTGKKMEA